MEGGESLRERVEPRLRPDANEHQTHRESVPRPDPENPFSNKDLIGQRGLHRANRCKKQT